MSDSTAAADEPYQISLAEEQTRLARERTILSHIRTGFASFLFGTAIYGLFGQVATTTLGAFFVLVGATFLVTGWLSYIRSNRRTQKFLEEVERPFRHR